MKSRPILFAIALSLAALTAQAAPPHIHGVALLDVAVDGDTLSLHLDTPLANLVGFEHPARNPAQKKALDAMVAQLNRTEDLFVPTPDADCRPLKPRLVSSVLEPPGKREARGHADMDADFVFHCTQPERLTGLDVKLRSAFPHIQEVKVQIAGPRGQSAVVLKGGASHIDL